MGTSVRMFWNVLKCVHYLCRFSRSSFDQVQCLPETMATLQQHDLAFFGLQTTYDEHDVSKAFRKFMAMHHPDKARTIFDCDLVAKSQNVRNRLLAALDSQKPITVDIPMLSPTNGQSWGFEMNKTTMELTKLHVGQHFQRECHKAEVLITVGWMITKINGQKHDTNDYDLCQVLRSLRGLKVPLTITVEAPKVNPLMTEPHTPPEMPAQAKVLQQPAPPPPPEMPAQTKIPQEPTPAESRPNTMTLCPDNKHQQWHGDMLWCSFCGCWKFGGRKGGAFGPADRSTLKWNVCTECRSHPMGDAHWWWCRDEIGNCRVSSAAIHRM